MIDHNGQSADGKAVAFQGRRSTLNKIADGLIKKGFVAGYGCTQNRHICKSIIVYGNYGSPSRKSEVCMYMFKEPEANETVQVTAKDIRRIINNMQP